jgi:hypothetical protein
MYVKSNWQHGLADAYANMKRRLDLYLDFYLAVCRQLQLQKRWKRGFVCFPPKKNYLAPVNGSPKYPPTFAFQN